MKTHTNILYILLATFLFFPIYHAQGEEVAGSPQGTFNVTPMGGASYSVAIDVPPGHGNMLPQIAIAYNSQSGMGIAGWGCNVSGISSITCGPHDVFHDGNPRGLKHDGSDAYYLDGVRLLYTSGPIGQSGCIYHPEGDPYTEVITCGSNTSTSQGLWFEMHTSTGLTIQFGNTSASRQDYTKDGQTKTNAWYVSRVENQSGNYMEYSYTKNQLYVYPSVISYGSNSNSGVSTLSTVEFSYTSLGSCAQPFRIDGVAGSMNYRLSSIVSKTASSVFRTYTLTYDITSDGTAVKFPRLQSITEADAGGNTLGPVMFEWEPLPAPDEQMHTMNANLTSDSYWLEVQEDRRIHAADVTGDGIPNLIEVVAVKEQSTKGWSHQKYMNVFNTYIGEDGLVHTDDSIRFYVNEVYASFFHSVRCGPFFIDMNGDGKNEIIMAHSHSDPSGDVIMARIYDINRSPRDSMVIKSTKSVHTDDIPLMCVGDFNNDGYGDFAALETGVHNYNIYSLHILQGANTTSGMGWTEIQISLPSAPKKLFLADMDSDGFQDLLILYNNGYKVIKNQVNLSTSLAFNDIDPYRYTGTNVGDMLNVEMGDFNGDGVADLLMNPSESGNWYYALGNGDCTFTKNLAISFNNIYSNSTSNDDNKFRCIVTDIDQDGKSDAIVIKAMYNGSKFLNTYVVWLLSNGTTLTEWRRAQSNKSSDALCARYTLGDFDGDGVEDLMNWGFDCSGNSGGSTTTALRFYLNPLRSLSSGKVTSVADGYGEGTRIEYGTLVDADVYTQENGSSFPVTNLTVPLHVVKQTESDNGVASAVEQTYQYAGLRLHRLGKGLLGFRSITVSNLLTGTEITTETVEMDSLRFVPLRSRVTTTLGNGTATVETTMTATECGYRNYSLLPASRTATDFDDNTITTIYNYYHWEGYPLSETTYYGSSNNYDETTYSDYVKKGTVWLPQTVETERRNSASQPVQTRRKTFSYDTRGLPVETVENAHSSLALTTTATYDAFGNVLSTTTSGNGVDALTKYYTYDTTGRFVTSMYTSPASASTTYTYDTWGNVLTETGTTNPSAPLTTTYTYDGFGNLIEEESPLGVTTTYTRSMGYDSSQGCTLISLLQQTDGQPWTQTWTDPKGRETLTESVGAGGIDISASKDYDSRGRLSCSTSQNGNVTVYVDYTYDNRDRVTAETHSTGRHINNDGQEAESLLGGTLTHITSCDSHGLPLYRGMKLGNTVLHEMYFQHAPATGNLLSRTGMTVGDTDVFTYDKMDRLVNADMGGHANVGMSYGVNGNIMHKDGVGDYNYGNYWQHPHAMKDVYDLGAQAPVGWQDMEYNALGKPASIYDWGLGQTLTLTYGPDGERWSGDIRDGNNNLVAEYRYIGDVETVRQANVYFPTYYYHLGHNVLAVDVHGTVSIYYMLTDPLGSVTDIYAADGTPVFRATYDPWGKQTVTLNTIGFRRGYCGHEMLSEFGLINMNARLYDPITARFLSPDNYVQDPMNSQNFNRYSYCLNNPLKYVDPDGNNPFLLFSIGYSAMWGAWKASQSGKSELGGAALGAITAVTSWAVGSTFGHEIGTLGQELLRGIAHGFANGLTEWAQGGNFGVGFATGTLSSFAASGIYALGGSPLMMLGTATITGAVTSSLLGGGWLNGAMTGMNIATFNHGWEIVNGEKVYVLDDVVCTASYWTAMKAVHTTLDVIGLVPVVGELADGLNAGLYLFKGDYMNASLSAAAMIPVAGDVATGGKYVVKGYHSYSAFKRANGAAGAGKAWHHIVEQTPSNVKRFGPELIHNIDNMVKLPHGKGSIHAKISGYYSSVRNFTGGLRVRDWLSTQSYNDQYEFGLNVLKQFGW